MRQNVTTIGKSSPPLANTSGNNIEDRQVHRATTIRTNTSGNNNWDTFEVGIVTSAGAEPVIVGMSRDDVMTWRRSRRYLDTPYLDLTGPGQRLLLLDSERGEAEGQASLYLSNKDQEQLNSLLELFSSDNDMQVRFASRSCSCFWASVETRDFCRSALPLGVLTM